MNKHLVILLTSLLGLTFFWQTTLGQIPAKPALSEGQVIDQADILSDAEEKRLENYLLQLDKSGSSQIVVYTLQKLPSRMNENDFAIGILNEWEVGEKGKDNGVVLLVAIDDKRVAIQTGYGAEQYLTDDAASRIISEDMRAPFRKGRYADGINVAVKKIDGYLTGKYKREGKYYDGESDGSIFGIPPILFFILAVFIFFLIFSVLASSGKRESTTYSDQGKDIREERRKRGRRQQRRRPVVTGYPRRTNMPRGGWWVFGGGSGRSRGGGGWTGGGGSMGGGGFGGFGGGQGGGGGASGGW